MKIRMALGNQSSSGGRLILQYAMERGEAEVEIHAVTVGSDGRGDGPRLLPARVGAGVPRVRDGRQGGRGGKPMTDIIEGEARDVTPTSSVATVQQGVQTQVRDPLRAIGTMTDADFELELRALIRGKNRMQQLQRDLLRPDVDYGTIPGTPKPTLLQPGAEQLAMFHRLIPDHHVTKTITEVPGHPDRIDIDARCHLHQHSLDGPVIQVSSAAASSYEDRYRWRIRQRTCPTCGAAAIIKGKAEWGGGWICHQKRGGCGAKFKDGYAPIESQPTGREENPEPYALLNTLVQMAQKRAFVSAVRHALGITDLFTEEIEEPRDTGEAPDEPQTAQAPAQQPARAPAAAKPAPAAKAADKPAGVWFEGPVIATPDGLRDTPKGKVLAFAIKVGNSKHNIELWDDMARAAQPYIVEGALIRVDGKRVEEDYPGRENKALKKVIKDVTVVGLTDAKGTRTIAGGGEPGTALPGAPAPSDEPPLFDDDLPFDRPAAINPPVEPVKQTGEGGASFDETGTIRNIEDRQTPQGKPYVHIELVDGDRLWVAAMSQEDADAHPAFALGQRVRLMGGWNTKGTLVIAGVMAPA